MAAKAGERLRIRFINAGSDTAFRVAVGGHRTTVTHTDGYPTEKFDVLVTLDDGVFPVVALAWPFTLTKRCGRSMQREDRPQPPSKGE